MEDLQDPKTKNETMLAKSAMIDSLVNAMKVNKEVLGTYHELRDICHEKLMEIIKSV